MEKPDFRAALEQPLLSSGSVDSNAKPFRSISSSREDRGSSSSSSHSGPASSPCRHVLKMNPLALVATLASLAIAAFLVTSVYWPLPLSTLRDKGQDVVLREDKDRTRRFLREDSDPFAQETASSGVALRPKDYDAQSQCGSLKEEPSFAVFEPEYHSADFPGVQGACAVDGAFEMLHWSSGKDSSDPFGLQAALGRRKLQLFGSRQSFQERACLPKYDSLQDCLRCCGAGCQAEGSAFRGRQCVPEGDTPSYTKTKSLTRTGTLPDSRWMSVAPDGGAMCRSHGTATCFSEATGAKGGPVFASDVCTGFDALDSCRSCCETCRAEPPNATFEGRGCSAVGQPVRRPVLGRPFLDQSTGEALLAPLVDATEASSGAWSPVAAVRGGSDSGAAQAWEEAAVAEYSSVGSFSRHLLDLMAVGGAPPRILEDVAAAAADEVRHAAASLQVARLLRGPDAPLVAPGALPMPSAPAAPPTLKDLAVEVLKDGCVEETVSAALAVAADLASASDTGADGPALGSARAAVDAIAREEAAHAQLAWRTLSWALEQQQPGIRESVQAHLLELKSKEASPQGDSMSNGGPAGSVNPHYGIVSRADEKLRVREAVMTRIVAPWLDALLEQPRVDGGRGSSLRKSLEDPARGRGEYMLTAIAAALQQGPEAVTVIGLPGAADDGEKETEL